MEDPTTQHRSEHAVIPEFDIGEYITSNPDGDCSQLDIFTDLQQHPSPPSQTNLETTMPQQNFLRSHDSVEYVSQRQPQALIVAEMLKDRLEQQMKLQQLQQLQNHILQRQIELISSRSSLSDQQKDLIFNGLLTPGPSTELRAMVPKDLVSPMMLQQEMYLNNSPSVTDLVDSLPSHQHDLSMSAPAALAFPTSPPFPLPSPAEPEFDLEPLTSPWLLPVPTQQKQQPPQQQKQYHGEYASEHSDLHPTRLKRAASISGDDHGMRKRPLSGVHSDMYGRRTGVPTFNLSSSVTSPDTASRPGLNSEKGLLPSQDTPSPVDISMPPPAPSTSRPHPTISSSSSSTSGTGSTSVSPDIAPVTPASIMNLGKLPTGLAPSNFHPSSLADSSAGVPSKKVGKGKNVTRPKLTVSGGTATRGRRDSVAKQGVSPNLKPILPGVSTSSMSQINVHSKSAFTSSSFSPTSGNTATGPRKTSHKAAEQKRRDSLKTSFDELRLLLPPVPLPDETGDDPPLPGSMPPRGPPKGDADGPNRGVSKLALLRCGNTYIRELKGKVGRRDAEIERLRAEVRRLQARTGDSGSLDVDLERDIDEGEYSVGSACRCGDDGDEYGEC